ncbi:MAG: hypothetical protein KIS74_02865 [Burkholderiales bacterium]|nr:hypothetical protein [Burkholderiales bacterium]
MSTAAEDKLTPEQAIAMLAEGELVHTFINPGVGMLIGADWTREEVIAAINEAGEASLTGSMATSMGHGIAIKHQGRFVFLATRKEG